MSKYFSIDQERKNFSNADFLGKLGNGTLIATKIVANVGIFALSTMAEIAGSNAKTISNNPNATSEQLKKAQEIKNHSSEILKNMNKDRSGKNKD